MTGELESLFMKQEELAHLRKAVKELEEAYECELAGVLSKTITEQDGYRLVEHTRGMKEIVPELFKTRFTDLYDKVVSIKKKDAQAELKKLYPKVKNIDAFLEEVSRETRTNISYRIVKE